GESEKTRIESQATLARDRLLAQARREATRLRGEGEAKAIETYNAAHAKNPAFYQLLKTLDTYRAILDEQTTVVLSADSPLLKLLTDGLPELPQGAIPEGTMPIESKGGEPAATVEPKATSAAATTAASKARGTRPNASPTVVRPEARP
ncbi:MAG: hypothetical protein ACREHD_06965, partial [Pirellulales bacterium]